MSELDLKLYSLLGDKTISFGCLFKYNFKLRSGREYFRYKWEWEWDKEECLPPSQMWPDNKAFTLIGHEPTLSDFHRWVYWNCRLGFSHQASIFYRTTVSENAIYVTHHLNPRMDGSHISFIPYDSSKSLLSQSDETKKQLIELIESHS